MGNKYSRYKLLTGLHCSNNIISLCSKFRLNYYCKGKRILIIKGMNWRLLRLHQLRTYSHVGEYLSSRKPFKRVSLVKRR